MEKPLYKHDCSHCDFLGSENGVDLYFHKDEKPIMSTLIARRSSDGPDYSSGLPFAFTMPYLNKALEKAIEADLITPEINAYLVECEERVNMQAGLKESVAEYFTEEGFERFSLIEYNKQKA